jgi:glycine cleavage system H protein
MRYYSREHLWIDVEESGATIGVCKYFLIRNSGITFIGAGENGKEVQPGDPLFTLENEKTVTEFPSPVTGIIADTNTALIAAPALLDSLSEEECWICKITLKHSDFSALMTREEYDAFIA